MPHHKSLGIGQGIHGILAGRITDASNLAAGIVRDDDFPDGRAVTVEDVGKVFQRLDNGAWYGLFTIAPVNWWVISSGALNAFEHGDLPGGTLHAVATTTVNGFYAAADKVLNDAHRADHNNPHATTAQQVGAISTASTMSVTGTPVVGAVLTATSTTGATWQLPSGGSSVLPTRMLNAGAGLAGGGDLSGDRSFDIVAADSSIAVNANSIQVGVLATDAQHGNRGGGNLHMLATPTTPGFMSPADKVKIDSSVSTPLSNVTPQPIGNPVPGSALESARIDHVHAHGNQPGGNQHALATTTTPGFMSAADKTTISSINTSVFARLAGGNQFTGQQIVIGDVGVLGNIQSSLKITGYSIDTGYQGQFGGDIASSRDLLAQLDIYSDLGNIFAKAGRIYTGSTSPPSVGDIRASNDFYVGGVIKYSPPRQFTRLVDMFRNTVVGVIDAWFWDSSVRAWSSNFTGPGGTLLIALEVPHFAVLNRVRLRVQPSAARSSPLNARMFAQILYRDRSSNLTTVSSIVYDDATANMQDLLFDNIGLTANNAAYSIYTAVSPGTGSSPTHDHAVSCEVTFTADDLSY